MKIQLDHQIFSLQKYGGISRYFYELIKEFDSLEGVDNATSLLLSDNYYISDKKYVKYIEFLPNTRFKGKNRLFSNFNKIKTINELKKQKFDIFHPTYYDPYFLEYIGNKPFVLTIHDMIHEKFKEIIPAKDHTALNKKLLANKASRIITVSENTKQDIIKILNIDQAKIDVIYHGNSIKTKLGNINIKLPSNYLLFIGSRKLYKNFEKFVIAITKLLQKDSTLKLVCVGGDNFRVHEIKLFNKLNIAGQILQFDLDDSSLAYFYKNALLFVFPSLYEGFGIPILEAFACNCPVVCSNTSSLPEIAGDAAVYFDPYDQKSIKDVIGNTLRDKKLREKLIILGRERLKYFSWEKAALETKRVYESIY